MDVNGGDAVASKALQAWPAPQQAASGLALVEERVSLGEERVSLAEELVSPPPALVAEGLALLRPAEPALPA
jgi:hypothetical protein